jgi:hypothetical protein
MATTMVNNEESNNTNYKGNRDGKPRRQIPSLDEYGMRTSQEGNAFAPKIISGRQGHYRIPLVCQSGPEVHALLTTANNNIGKGTGHRP